MAKQHTNNHVNIQQLVHFSICIEKTTKTGGGVNWNSVQLAHLVGHQLALLFQKPYNFR